MLVTRVGAGASTTCICCGVGVERGWCPVGVVGVTHCWALRHQAQLPCGVVWLVGFLVFVLLIVDASIGPRSPALLWGVGLWVVVLCSVSLCCLLSVCVFGKR